jgi:hypothetical protein
MLNWLFGGSSKRRNRPGQSDRAERNAIIKRVVAAAAKNGNKNQDSLVQHTEPTRATESVAIGPLLLSSATVTATSNGNIPQDQIAERAYQIWVRNGRPTGTAERDWQQAVVELSTAANA